MVDELVVDRVEKCRRWSTLDEYSDDEDNDEEDDDYGDDEDNDGADVDEDNDDEDDDEDNDDEDSDDEDSDDDEDNAGEDDDVGEDGLVDDDDEDSQSNTIMMQSRSIDQLAMQVEESKCQDNIYHMKSMIKGCQTIMQVRKNVR